MNKLTKKLNDPIELDSFIVKKRNEEDKGFELIKKFVELYPKTEYPSVNDDLLELFVKGARLLGINHIIVPGDDQTCPDCNEVTGVVEKGGLSLDTAFGMATMCNYCYVQQEQDEIINHTPESCDHPKENITGESCWTWHDCLAVAEAFEYSYKEILKEIK